MEVNQLNNNVDGKCSPTQSQKDRTLAQRIGLNEHKAGMHGLDKEKINKIIMEASRGSKYYENERKKDQQLQTRIDSLRLSLEACSDDKLRGLEEQADAMLAALESELDLSRYIVHVDMDAFYASVEMRDNPALCNVPMAVGGESMLSTSNYVARRYGVRAAMPGFIARKLCPDLVLVPANMPKYLAASKVIRHVLKLYDLNVCGSVDEASLDFTNHLGKRAMMSEHERTYPQYSEEHCRCDPHSDLPTEIEPVQETNATELTEKSGTKADNLKQITDLKGQLETGVAETSLSDSKDAENGQSELRVTPGLEQSDIPSTEEAVGDAELEDRTRRMECDDVNTSAEKQQQDNLDVCLKCGLPFNLDQITFGMDVESAVDEMRHRVRLKTRLTASAGIAVNCMLSKICSDQNKPNGQFYLERKPEAIQRFIQNLHIRKVPGIGKVSEKTLSAFGISTVADFHRHRGRIRFLFSESTFEYFMSVYLGISSNRVMPNEDGPKSKSVERTFSRMSDPATQADMCYELCLDLADDLQQAQLKGKTITIKLKHSNFSLKTRSHSISFPTNSQDEICQVALGLLKTEIRAAHPNPLHLRLMGVRMSNFVEGKQQQTTLKPVVVSSSESFFERVERERQEHEAAELRKPQSLGLLSYMCNQSELSTIIGRGESEQPVRIDGANQMCRYKTTTDIWSTLEVESSNSRDCLQNKSLPHKLSVDSDNSADPWEILNKQTSKRDPPKARSQGAIENFLSKTKSSWSVLDNEVSSSPMSSTPARKQTRLKKTNHNRTPSTNNVVRRFFLKKTSAPESDDDIVCIEDPYKTTKRKSIPLLCKGLKKSRVGGEASLPRRAGLRSETTRSASAKPTVVTISLSSDDDDD